MMSRISLLRQRLNYELKRAVNKVAGRAQLLRQLYPLYSIINTHHRR